MRETTAAQKTTIRPRGSKGAQRATSLPFAPESSPDTTYWLPVVGEGALQQLSDGVVSDAEKALARHLLQPLTRTDAGVTTRIYREVT